MMSTSVGTAQLDLGINYKGFNNQLKGIAGNAQGMVGNAFKGLGKIIGAAFATKQLIDFGKAAIGLASDLDEVQNVVDVTFKEMANNVNVWSKSVLHQFGLSELSAKKFSSTMGAMLKSSGISGKAVLDMSKTLTELTADMASFYNLEHEATFNKIRSGISGETEPLKQLGINMSVANMEAFALSKGITKSYQAMSQAEQMQLRYNYLLNATADSHGDFARTSDSWANQTKLLTEQWKIFQTTMGQGLINVLTPFVQTLNTIIQKLQVAAQYFKAFTEVVMGISKSNTEGVASAIDLGEAAQDAGDGVSKANKKMKSSLGSFDQLNTITQGAASAMSDIADDASVVSDIGGIDFSGSGDVDLDASKLDPFKKQLENIISASKEIFLHLGKAFGPTLKDSLDSLQPSIQKLKDMFGNMFSGIDEIGKPLIAFFENNFIPYIKQVIKTTTNIFGGLLDSLIPVITDVSSFVKTIFKGLLTDGLPTLYDFATDAMSILDEFWGFIKQVFDSIWRDVVKPAMDLVSSIIVDVLASIRKFWDDWGGKIVGGFKDAINNISNLFSQWWETIFKPIWDRIVEMIKWLWDNHLKGLVDGFLEFVGKLVDGALEIYNKFIVPLVSWFIDFFGPSITNAFQFVVDAIGTVIAVVSDVVKGILKALGGIIDFLVGIFTGDWDKAWEGIKTTFSGIWDAIVSILKGAVNLIIDAINWMIRGLNKVKINIPDWISELVGLQKGATFGFKIKEIPKLAEGGLISGPTLAMVGDNRNARSDPEVVSPLSKLQEMLGASNQAVVEVLKMILEAIRSGDKEMVMQLNNTEFGKVAIKAINDYQRMSGKVMIIT